LLIDGSVRAAPGVIVDESITPAVLGDAAYRTEPEVTKVAGLTPRKDTDMAERDLFGQLPADEAGGQSGGSMAAVVKGGLEVLVQGVRRKKHGSAPGTKGIV
jgi:hypothetical protein